MARVERPMKPDYFPVFPMHLLGDEDYEGLDRSEWGSVFLLMQHQWIKGGTLPDDPRKLAGMAKCSLAEFEDLQARWMKLKPVDGQPGRVAIPFLLREYERAVASWEEFRQKQAEKGRQSAEVRLAKFGTAQPKKPEPGIGPVSNHGSSQSRTMVQTVVEPAAEPSPNPHPIPSHPIREEPIGSSSPAPRKRAPAKPKESLEEILGGGKGTPIFEAYWKLVGTFGGQPKNPAPKTTARLYAEAVGRMGLTPEHIQAKAEVLRRGTSEAKFMPQLRVWLDGQGYMTPDELAIPRDGPGRSPAHRARADAEYREINGTAQAAQEAADVREGAKNLFDMLS